MNERKIKINSQCKIIKTFFRNERELLNTVNNFFQHQENPRAKKN